MALTTTHIDLAPLQGAMRRILVSEPVRLPAFNAAEFPEPLAVELDIERNGSTVSVTGSVEGHLLATCDRCLGHFRSRVDLPVVERFTIGSDGDPYGDGNVVAGDQLDLGDLVRQVVDAALPLTMTCKDDCAGLCAHCGTDLNEGTCQCEPLLKGDHGQP